jgi:cellulase
MMENAGWHYFTMPTCVAPGDYLMRVELLALHSASSAGGAQFYMEVSNLPSLSIPNIEIVETDFRQCAQIKVTGTGTSKGSNFVSFPGAYQANDPGIVVSIYDSKGNPYPSSYKIPGPAPLVCSASENGSGSGSDSGSGTTPPVSEAPSGSGAALYAQCGGTGWTGAKGCIEGTCTPSGDYYSQCLPS